MGNLGNTQPLAQRRGNDCNTQLLGYFFLFSSFFSCRLLIVDYKHFFLDYELLLFPYWLFSLLVIFSVLVTFAISYRSMKQAAFMGHFVFAFVLRFINCCLIFTSPCLLLDDSELYCISLVAALN